MTSIKMFLIYYLFKITAQFLSHDSFPTQPVISITLSTKVYICLCTVIVAYCFPFLLCVHACLVTSVLSDSATLWTVARQAPLSISPGKNTGVGCHALLQGIFLTQGSNRNLLCLLHWQVDSLLLNHS